MTQARSLSTSALSQNLGRFGMALSLLGNLSASALAENVDAEIAKLKKQNELLELQKKNKALKQDKISESSSELSELSGWFVGAELGYSPNVKNFLSISANANYLNLDSTTYALPLNLTFGYLLYPWENAGFKFKGYVGYASYNSKFAKTYSDNSQAKEIGGTQDSQALHYGLEAEYLYDFISTKTHSFGINVGVGYEFGTFMGQKINNTIANNSFTYTNSSYTDSSFTSSIGVHYFYKIHHHFELKYRYCSGYGAKQQKAVVSEGNETIQYATAPWSTLILGYSYKF